ncbi:DMT family transporter [Pimelobacter simplex]|uniref:DMT family transporter n=1 Tax=Nocardioides simplex TaxID=2045 RepID=UPI0019340741|nr:EamA family transporter [Pimelobacter simplex]
MGVLLVLVSATAFGAMAVFGKLAYGEGVTPQALVLVRFVLAAVLLCSLVTTLAARSGRPAVPTPATGSRTRLVVVALALGALGYATQATLYFAALERIDASLVALVLYTFPTIVTIAAILLGRERATLPRLVALAVASAGTLLVLLGAGGVRFDVLGVTYAFGAALTYSVYILVGDTTVRQLPPLTLTAVVMTGAALTHAVRAAVTGGVDLGFTAAGWFWIACVAVVSTVVASTAFFAGLRRVGPSTAAILSMFEPVATVTLATVVLGESLAPLQLAGGLLVLSSIALVQRRRPGRGGRATPHPQSRTDVRATTNTRRKGSTTPRPSSG